MRTALKKLEKTGEITTKSTNKFTLITVVKWRDFQGDGTEDNKQTNNQITNNQKTTDNQITINQQHRKNVKNVNNVKECKEGGGAAEHPGTYFEFLDLLSEYEIGTDNFVTPRYASWQKLHVFRMNKITERLITDVGRFETRNGIDYSIDLVFFKRKLPIFRCISEVNTILITDEAVAAFITSKPAAATP